MIDGLNSGTPKNTGAEVVYSRHLPSSWQGSIITSDFRANRTVRYAIQPNNSGYQSEEVETILHSSHRSYRPVDTKVGPDGAVYIVDWYNPIIDHGEVDFHHPVRDKTHGRIWRLTNKNKPLVPKPKIFGASISELLDHLKSPEQNTRIQANRELVAQHCSPKMLSNWVLNLRQSDPDYERHRLEALWLGAALNAYDDELLNSLLQANNPKVRAGAVRMVMKWNQQQQKLEILADLIHDPHPQVRLETIHALRTLGNLRSAELTLQALDQPLDQNLDFAIWHTVKTLKNVWLPALINGQTDFSGDINKQMFALIACNDVEVIGQMTDLIKRPELSDTLAKQAWHSLARLGDAETLSMVLQKAVSESNIKLLKAMADAPKSNISAPTDGAVLLGLLKHDNSNIRIAALQLVGRWHLKEAANMLINKAQDLDASSSERLAACKAMIKIDQLEAIKKLAKSPHELSIRTTACAAWIEEEPEDAVKSVVDLLQNLEDPKDAELIFMTYRKLEDGPAILTKALSGTKLSEPIASAGLRVAQTSGLDLSEMEKVLREAGSLEAVGIEMSNDEKKQLLADVAASGNGSRGNSIYRRPQLLCATCHQIKGIGGLIGPDLTTVGSYMTPNSILESILNPGSDIKQGYETVIITKTNGEVLSGTLYRKTDSATLLRQANGEILTVPASEITKIDVSPVSLMPQGLTASLHRDELRDLIYYLTHLGVPPS
ncbi:MAG: HEAT repeat domain-containing protein [Saprospiraceae bacterium]|nr:HEAT repeat domain-containing protein [Saprospiraceae bacterium]